jgi:hypothetical protein
MNAVTSAAVSGMWPLTETFVSCTPGSNTGFVNLPRVGISPNDERRRQDEYILLKLTEQ